MTFVSSSAIVSSPEPVTLVGGSHLSDSDLTISLSLAPTLVAADGGAQRVLAAGLRPVAVIGDMDSISDSARAAFAGVLHEIGEQESTDFDKALRNIDAPVVIAVGVTGGGLGHQMAMLSGLVGRPERACVALGGEDVVFLCPPALDLDLAAGTPVSLFPMGPVRVGSTGLVWPTEGLDFDPSGRIGTSNRATGPVGLRADRPGMLVILPRETVGVVVRALRALPPGARWPARGG
jgi:thiamine pyrophosphokinase